MWVWVRCVHVAMLFVFSGVQVPAALRRAWPFARQSTPSLPSMLHAPCPCPCSLASGWAKETARRSCTVRSTPTCLSLCGELTDYACTMGMICHFISYSFNLFLLYPFVCSTCLKHSTAYPPPFHVCLHVFCTQVNIIRISVQTLFF